MKYSRLVLFFFIVAFVGQHVPAQLQGPSQKSACERPLSVGMNSYEPYAYRENGRLKGLGHDLFLQISERSGCQFVETELSRGAALDQINKDRIDMLALVIQTPEVEHKAHYIPLYDTHRELTVAKKNFVAKASIEHYLADEKIKFANLIGSPAVISKEEELKLLRASRLVGVPNPEQAFRLLREGRVQALVFTAPVASYYIEKLKMSDVVERVVDVKVSISVGIYVSKSRLSPEEKATLDNAVTEIKKDGSFLRIFSKYIPNDGAAVKIQSPNELIK